MAEDTRDERVDRFVLEEVDSVPHLEALLLLRNSRQALWTAKDLAGALYIVEDRALEVLRDWTGKGLFTHDETASPERFRFAPQPPEREELLALLDAGYRHDLVRISTMIHNKKSPVREFARAFDLRKPRG